MHCVAVLQFVNALCCSVAVCQCIVLQCGAIHDIPGGVDRVLLVNVELEEVNKL